MLRVQEVEVINPIKAGLFEGSIFCEGGGQFDHSFIFQEQLI